MLKTYGSGAGFGSNYSTRCASLLPMLSQSSTFLRSVGSEKRLPESRWGIFAKGIKPEVGV